MKQKITLILSILLGLFMATFGLNKFMHFMPMPEMNEAAGALMGAFGTAIWLFPLIALVEIIGGVLLAIPKTRIIGAMALLPISVGIVLFHTFQDKSGLGMGIGILIVLLYILGSNCDKITKLMD